MNIAKPGYLMLSAVLVVSLAGIGLAKNKDKDKDDGHPRNRLRSAARPDAGR